VNLLLDTNIVSLAMSADPGIMKELARLAPDAAAISAVTYAEIRYGLRRGSSEDLSARQSVMTRKQELFDRLMGHVDILPWDRDAAAAYAEERIACERDGQALDQADLMILAHAGSTGRILVTRDAALQRRSRKGPHKTKVVGW
jgi:predicted nucleic acid-binding protein